MSTHVSIMAFQHISVLMWNYEQKLANMKKNISTESNEPLNEDEFYCKECGGCGYIGCCGIRHFLEVHVKGKTSCLNEEAFIADIISHIDNHRGME